MGLWRRQRNRCRVTIDQDCNVADTKPDVEKMIQTRGMVKIQETEMMIDRVRMKGRIFISGTLRNKRYGDFFGVLGVFTSI